MLHVEEGSNLAVEHVMDRTMVDWNVVMDLM